MAPLALSEKTLRIPGVALRVQLASQACLAHLSLSGRPSFTCSLALSPSAQDMNPPHRRERLAFSIDLQPEP